MFKAFIVDDDYTSIETFYNSFDWKKLNITDVQFIQNPIRLAERIESEKPDVVFVDIEMGDVSGLDIISRVNEQSFKPIFVIVSGHDDFVYAKQAIKYGVTYYLLKPISSADIDDVTERLIDSLNSVHTGPLAATDPINTCLTDKTKFEEYILENGVTFPGSYRFLVAQSEREIIDDFVMCLGKSLVVKEKIGIRKYLFVVNSALYTDRIKLLLHNLVISKRVYIGVSDEGVQAEDIYSLFRQANTLSYGYFIYQKWDVYVNDTYAGIYMKNFLDELNRQMDSKKIEKILATLEKAPGYFIAHRFNIKHAVLMHNVVTLKINSSDYQQFNGDSLPMLNTDDLINEYDNLSHMCKELGQLLGDFLSADAMKPGSAVNKETFRKVLDYINHNYSEKISLAMLSEKFYISVSYICALFKQNTEQTFIEYLTGVRMKKAKEILENSSIRTALVAEKLGYSDYFYFNKLFKKYYGCTPYEYRRNLERERKKIEN